MEDQPIEEYRSSLLNFMLMPLIGLAVIFLGVTPFLIEGGLGVSTGFLVFSIICFVGGALLVIYPFMYRLMLFPDGVVHKKVWGEKFVPFDDVVNIGNVEQRIMNGTPIAINTVELLRSDGSRFELSLRNIGMDQAESVIGYIQGQLPFDNFEEDY